jgi:hypothetical protein
MLVRVRTAVCNEARCDDGDPHDNALITLGVAYAQINAAMLAALTAQRLSQAGDDKAELWDAPPKRTV